VGVNPYKIMTARLALLTLMVAVSLCIQGCERKLTVQESDKTLFLRAQDLVDYGYGFPAIEKYESFTKAKAIDGSYDLEYEFETPDAEQSAPLFLYVLVSIGKKKSDAQISQQGEKIALLSTLKAKGIQEEEIPNFYGYGDSSSFYVLKKEGKPIGNYFTVREGSKTYTVILSGMYFDDPQVWKEIMEPKLSRFSAYEPV
jgi:hypothetical protein